jgi:hypothetical protein
MATLADLDGLAKTTSEFEFPASFMQVTSPEVLGSQQAHQLSKEWCAQ